MDGHASVLIWVGLTLGRDGVELVGHGLPGLDATVLQNDGRISENEINGADDLAIAIKLAIRVCVQSVLIGLKGASVEN